MSFIAWKARCFAAVAVFAALAFVALPTLVHAEGDPVTVTGTVEVGPGDAGPIEIVSESEGRFVVEPKATADVLRRHAGRSVTAKGTVAKDTMGHRTLSVTAFELDEG